MDTTTVGNLAGRTLGGRYVVERRLARGGMATVYLGMDNRLDRVVALKMLRPDLCADPEFLARFQREAKATAALSHPNVVAVHDFDIAEEGAYLVLEHVPGHTLRQVLTDHGLSPSQALAVLEPILDALVAAHDAGIMHRDIKPENILMGPRGMVKVADFGLARALDDLDNKTRTGMVIGTAAYVSPEHVLGTGTSTSSDIYSAGILLFEMLTGNQPYTGDTPLSVAFQHVHRDVPRPSALVPGIPTELDELVLGATAREPGDRFPSAQAFLDEVRRVRSIMPPPQPLPPPQGRDSTVILSPGSDGPAGDDAPTTTVGVPDDPPPRRRRRRLPLVLAALVTLGLIGGAAWAFFAGPLQRATVPNLVGLTQANADVLLAVSGISMQVTDQQYSETMPKDVVISQNPPAESSAFIRFPVEVVVSLGPERYLVPEVRGSSVTEAASALEAAKLAVAGQTTAFDEDVAPGLVVGSDPAAGASLKPQTPVTLIVSDGPAPRPVPELLGLSKSDATAALQSIGLAATTTAEFSEKYPEGTVAAVDPPAGTEVAKGSTVTLTISKGPPPVEVPRVVDMKRDEAVARLESLGFIARVQEGILTPLNRVYSQDPAPGELLPKGSTVTISIF